MAFRHTRRVDWNEEIKKTENIQRRGFAMSFLSFVMAAVLIFGAMSSGNANITLPPSIIGAVCFAAACAVFGIIIVRYLRSKSRKSEERNEGENK